MTPEEWQTAEDLRRVGALTPLSEQQHCRYAAARFFHCYINGDLQDWIDDAAGGITDVDTRALAELIESQRAEVRNEERACASNRALIYLKSKDEWMAKATALEARVTEYVNALGRVAGVCHDIEDSAAERVRAALRGKP